MEADDCGTEVRRLTSKLAKKSYKEACKFTINRYGSLLSKPDRPHKTPAPHVSCKLTNKKAHTVFSFNESPEKLLKLKSPHMLTAEVQEHHRPAATVGLLPCGPPGPAGLAPEVKKLYSPPIVEGYRYFNAGCSREGLNLMKEGKYPGYRSAGGRPTTAQLLYQRQLSKQEVRPKCSSSEHPDHDPSDPFRFTSNGHSSPEKSEPEPLDRFAYHSPERPSNFGPTGFELKAEQGEVEEEEEQGGSLTSPHPPLAARSVSMPTTPSPSTEDKPDSGGEPSKLHRGKLSFFKQAISQEVSTMVESEKKAKERDTPKDVKLELRSPTKDVVRKVVKRPQPPQPHAPLPVHGGDKAKVVHSISASPIPLQPSGGKHFVNGHKVNVVKIEKHHMPLHHAATTAPTTAPPPLSSVFHKDLSVFKFSEHPDPMLAEPPLRRKRKSSEQDSRAKKALKDHLLATKEERKEAKGKPIVRVKTEGCSGGKPCEKKKSGGTVKKNNPGIKSPVRKSPPSLKSPTPKNPTPKTPSLKSPPPASPPPLPPALPSSVAVSAGTTPIPATSATAAGQSLRSPGGTLKTLKTLNMPEHDEEDDVPVKVKKQRREEAAARVKQERHDAKVKQEKRTAATPSTSSTEKKAVVKTLAIPTPPSSLLVDPKTFLKIEVCPDGAATVVRLDMADFESMSLAQQNLTIDYFFEVTFGETDGVADHVMGVISNGAREMPNVLSYLLENAPGIKVKHEVLGRKDVVTCNIAQWFEKVKASAGKGYFNEGGLQHLSLVGTKSEEAGAMFGELIDVMESNPFLEATLPWGPLSRYEGLDPATSNDGPIFWVRPGEQFLQSTSGSRNHKGYRLLKNRETLVGDRTRPHADHSWEDGKTIVTTAAAAYLQPVEIAEHPVSEDITLKDVIAFDAGNFYQLAEELQLDLYEPPMTQCEIWIDDAKMSQLRALNIKFSRIRLRAHDIYFIPRNVIHQFKTVACCASIAWHVRLKQYYD